MLLVLFLKKRQDAYMQFKSESVFYIAFRKISFLAILGRRKGIKQAEYEL